MADSIRKSKRKVNFTTVNNDYLHDRVLSWKGKGLITYIMSLPDEWRLNISDLKNRSKDGRDATSNGINELIDNGYCVRHRVRNDNGMFDGYDYEVSDIKIPQSENTVSVNPITENPVTGDLITGNPNSANPILVNTNVSNETLLVNTKESINVATHENASLFPDLEKEKLEEEKRLEAERLALEEEKKRKTLFRTSEIYKLVNFDISPQDYSKFEKCFPGDEYEKIDLVYYFHSVSDWSDQKHVLRTKQGWLATIRNFIRGDVEKNKLKLKAKFKPETQKMNVAGAMEYLTDY